MVTIRLSLTDTLVQNLPTAIGLHHYYRNVSKQYKVEVPLVTRYGVTVTET